MNISPEKGCPAGDGTGNFFVARTKYSKARIFV